MNARATYLILCVLGTLVPGSQFVDFVRDHGLSAGAFADQMFGTPIAAFFSLDVIMSSFALWFFVYVEGRRAGVRHLWVPIAANLAVGVSLGLPLFLYLREHAAHD